MKAFWGSIKENAGAWFLAILTSACFMLGKIYTWDAIITDCKVLGTFRIANTAFMCKMMVP